MTTNSNWEKTVSRQKGGGAMGTIVQILTLGIAENPKVWEVEFRNRLTGQTVKGSGTSEAEAERRALSAV